MSTKRIVQLRVYKGGKLSYTKDGKVQNESQTVTLPYKSREWENFMKGLRMNGYADVGVEWVKEEKDGKYNDVEKEQIASEVKSHFHKDEQVQLTPEQKKIKELEEKVARLLAEDKARDEPPKISNIDSMSLADLKKEFPNVADLGITKVKEFRARVKELHPVLA